MGGIEPAVIEGHIKQESSGFLPGYKIFSERLLG
jgi:hypothetical protein